MASRKERYIYNERRYTIKNKTMDIIYFYIFLLIHPYLALWHKSFVQAERKSWEALIPGYNYFIAFKFTINKPWWSLLLIFPGVHLVMWSVINVSYIRRFGYYSFLDTLQGIFFPYIIFYKIVKNKDPFLPQTNWANSVEVSKREWGDHIALFLALPVIGHILALGIGMFTRHKPGEKTKVKEWGDSLIYAIVAASILRTYVFEPFQIPTGSMEKTLLVGDFLFVNKLAYGPRVPMTPLSYPLVHNNVPWVNIPSYTTLETSSYRRLPGLGTLKRNDVVVFNFPSGDTAVYDPRMPYGLMGHDYHGIVIFEAQRLFEQDPKTTKDFQIAFKFYSDSLTKSISADSVKINIEKEAEFRAKDYIYGKFIKNLEYWKDRARHFLAVEKKAFDRSTGEIIEHYGLIYRPVDKRENYIKRCVAVPKDWVELKSSTLYINDKPAFVAPNQNLEYTVRNVKILSTKEMDEKYGLEAYSYAPGYYYPRRDYRPIPGTNAYIMQLTKKQIELLKKDNPDAEFIVNTTPQYSDDPNYKPNHLDYLKNLNVFPKDPYVNNTMTDFHKFQVPYKGLTVKLTKDNIPWYRRIITAYEGHRLSEREDGIYIDNKKTDRYTFNMDYYWMMGDNRYNSADSRVWGFVPEDHVVGKASMVWFSKSPYKGIRWERIFKVIE